MDLMTLLFIVLAFVIGLVIGGGFMFYLKNKHLERALWTLGLLLLLLQDCMQRFRQEQTRSAKLADAYKLKNKDFEKALWTLGLLRPLLQDCMQRFRQEQTRSAKLADAYKKLDKNYRDFCGEVQSHAKRRVVKRAVSAFAGLVPGLGLVDLVIGLGDILDMATDAEETVASLTTDVDSQTLLEVPNDGQTLLALGENAQSQVIETLKESDLEALNEDTLDPWVKDSVQRLENSVKSMSPRKRREAIEKVVDELKDLGIVYHDYRKTQDFPKKESSSGYTNSHCLNDDA